VIVEIIDLGTFSRQWAIEGRRIAWLLGAGASASACVPTAGQIVLDLLARMYAAAHGLVLQELNLGDPSTRDAILAYYDGMNGMPPAGDPSDYSTAFALALPDEGPRRQYLRGSVARPGARVRPEGPRRIACPGFHRSRVDDEGRFPTPVDEVGDPSGLIDTTRTTAETGPGHRASPAADLRKRGFVLIFD
jgi:hypothetical protein